MSKIANILTEYKDLISIAIASFAFFISCFSLFISKKLQRKQLDFEDKTVPVLFFMEISGHLSSIIRTLDYVNPKWMTRGSENNFDSFEFSHSKLKTTSYKSCINKMDDLSIRIIMENYYAEIDSFNSRGTELLEGRVPEPLNVKYFVQGGAVLVRTAYDLCDSILDMLDSGTKRKKPICSEIENVNKGRKYGLTVVNSTQLNITDLNKIGEKIEKDGIEPVDKSRYPMPEYVRNLYKSLNKHKYNKKINSDHK